MSDILIAGRYRLIEQIAVGGMGVVWAGQDEVLGRKVAVKQVRTQAGLSEADALLARDRVIREARITARLHHPHAVTIYDVVDDGDYPCLIMQFVPSSSLNALLRERGTLSVAEAHRIGADLAGALQAAHAVGIVHRDVKPGNILITDDGSAKLTDFGISHAAGDVTLTSTGMVSGTPAYLAPEVARGAESGFAADVFSLGATLYATLEGTPPFGLDTNPMAVLHRVASGQLIAPRRSGQLTPLLLQMMAPNPADRPTMAEVAHRLTLPAIGTPPDAALMPSDQPALRPAPNRVAPAGAVRTLPVSRSGLFSTDFGAPAGSPVTPAPSEPSRRPVTGSPAEPTTAEPNSGAQPTTHGNPQAAAGSDSRSGIPTPGNRAKRRPALAVLAAVVVLTVAVVAGFLLVNRGDGGQGAIAAPTTSAAVAPAEAPVTSDDATTSAESTTTASNDTASNDTASNNPASSNPASSNPAAPGTTADAATALAAALTDYYAVMPGNTEAGWERLTPSFQSGIARDREYYNSFWAGVAQVSVADVVGTPPDSVEATVTYQFTDGSVSVERTAYRLIQDGAGYRIDSSTVLSSQSG